MTTQAIENFEAVPAGDWQPFSDTTLLRLQALNRHGYSGQVTREGGRVKVYVHGRPGTVVATGEGPNFDAAMKEAFSATVKAWEKCPTCGGVD